MSRVRLEATIGLLTGHMALRARLFNMKIADSNECRPCRGYGKEDSSISYASVWFWPVKDTNSKVVLLLKPKK